MTSTHSLGPASATGLHVPDLPDTRLRRMVTAVLADDRTARHSWTRSWAASAHSPALFLPAWGPCWQDHSSGALPEGHTPAGPSQKQAPRGSGVRGLLAVRTSQPGEPAQEAPTSTRSGHSGRRPTLLCPARPLGSVLDVVQRTGHRTPPPHGPHLQGLLQPWTLGSPLPPLRAPLGEGEQDATFCTV